LQKIKLPYSIKYFDRNYIPTITLLKLPRKNWPLKVGEPTQLVLKFTNPLYEEMNITLATPQIKKKVTDENSMVDEESKIRGKVTILSPHFTVGAYNETIEYDDEMYPVGSNRRNNNNYAASSYADGVYEKRNNYTSILVEVVPEQAGEFKVNIHLIY
jgi:dynactin-4